MKIKMLDLFRRKKKSGTISQDEARRAQVQIYSPFYLINISYRYYVYLCRYIIVHIKTLINYTLNKSNNIFCLQNILIDSERKNI